jgi:membrane associated rhomboid family serine protease
LALYLGAGILAGAVHVGFMAYSQGVDDYVAHLRRAGVSIPLGGFADRLAILANEPSHRLHGIPPFPDSRIPTIGASGAISGVMGAYAVLFPKARVLTFIPPLIFFTFEIPAILFIGIWIATQAFGLWDYLASRLFEDFAGIAYGAHFGGFVLGILLAFALRPPRRDDTLAMEIR